ncbi:MAG: carboxypeptidase-like regulatory domain-containing protein, partial [Terracidiphilus sp.]
MRIPRIALICSLALTAMIAAQTPPKTDYSISGTVVNAASGEPVRRAMVSVQTEADRQTLESVETDSDGHFSLDGLPAGKYPLTASKRGFLAGFYDEHENFNTAIVTGADQETSGLVFKLTPGASLRGVVMGDGGDPVEGAQVMLFLKP